MGDEEEAKHPPDTPASTPNSTLAQQSGNGSGPKAPKDRNCPFCGQAFTSSSLGRHLDLYIKPKNAKPPDGVHNVDEIRKIRGNITRRQARTSAKASHDGERNSSVQREDSHDMSNHASAAKLDSQTAEDSPMVSPINLRDIQEGYTVFNAANWQATGVINNLPPRVPSRNNDEPPAGQAQRVQEMRRNAGEKKSPRPEYESESMWKLQQDAELGRAAEMALREVLGSLEAAQKRVEPRTLFDDFDFFALSFPGLCLAILPPPGTLFSPTPFPSADSWTLGPPGLRQYEALNRYVNERITSKRKTENFPDSVAFKIHSHLSGSWEHWQNMSETDRTSAWTLETLRSFTRAQDQKKSLRTDLEQSQQHVKHLEAEYNRLSQCQLPREYLMHPPNTISVSSNVMREIKPSQFKTGIAETGYDVEALLSKWRATIRATQRPSRVAKQTSGHSASMYTEQHSNHIRDALVMNGAVWNVGGPVPRHREPHTERLDSDGDMQSVSYETPPNPGAVMVTDDNDGARANEDAEGDADDNADSSGNYTAQSALVRRRRELGRGIVVSSEDGNLTGLANANGKRPLTSPGKGGRGTTKIYKARNDGD